MVYIYCSIFQYGVDNSILKGIKINKPSNVYCATFPFHGPKPVLERSKQDISKTIHGPKPVLERSNQRHLKNHLVHKER
jgi:hypothetical protein